MTAVHTPQPKEASYQRALGAYKAARYDDARSIIEEEVLDTDTHDDGSDALLPTELMANALVLLGNIHATSGDIGRCDERFREAFELLTVAFGPSHVGHATVLVNHSSVLIRRWQVLFHDAVGRLREGADKALIFEAMKMLFAAHNIVGEVLGLNRVILADACHNIGVCLEIIGRPVDALEYYMKSIKIRCRVKDSSGLTELCMATSAENVAMIYRLMAKQQNRNDRFLTEASDMLANVIRIRSKHLGPLSGALAEAYFNLGLVELDRGQPRSSRENFQRSLKIRGTIFGQEHDLTKLAAHMGIR